MDIKAILFDLDGTLLPMDNDLFTKGYFRLLAKKLAPHGYDPQELVAAILKGTEAMVRNDGSATNCDAFWRKFAEVLGEKVYEDKCVFDEFYENEFNDAKQFCGFTPKASEIIDSCKKKGYRLLLASNPLFPMAAQKARLGWAGISPDSFEFISSYENSHFCKPNPEYFSEMTERLKLAPEECLVIGNDADEDMAAKNIGASVFLLTDCVINRGNKEITQFPHGGFEELAAFLGI